MPPLEKASLLKALGAGAMIFFLISIRAHSEQMPCIEIHPTAAFIGESIRVRLRGFEPSQPVLLRLRTTNMFGRTWESHAEFLTDSRGRIDLRRQAPLSGTYRLADASGLFWSMARPAGDKSIPESGGESLNPADLQFTAESKGHILARAKLERLFIAPGVRRVAVRDGRLRGAFFIPPGKRSHPAVLVVGGSEGGLHELDAAFLASKGYASLALAYFDFEDLPKSFANIPLEYFETALDWLRSRTEVRREQIAVMGGSRGGELALLLGSQSRRIRAVIAFAPSGIIWPGIDPNGADEAAWTFRGRPVPFLSNRDATPEQKQQIERVLSRQPIDFAQLFSLTLQNTAAVEKATIPVQKINGPVLLVSGDDDRVWPSTLLANKVMEQLKQAKHPFSDRHLAYAGAGHFIPLPHLPATVHLVIHPVTKTEIVLGGDTERTAAAAADSWAQILKFLRSVFGP